MHPLIAHWLKILGVVATAIAALVAVLVLFLALILPSADDLCGNSVLSEAVAPGGQLKAVVFERNCGATTDFSTQVSLIEANTALPNRGGNVFGATTDRGRSPSGPGAGPDVKAIWVGPASLRIEHHPMAHVLASSPLVSGVHIQYAILRSDG
jgi:hypothetical protein